MPAAVIALSLLGGGVWEAGAQSPEPAAFPSLVSSVRIAGPLSYCGERVPLEFQEVRERLEKELMLSLWDRPQVVLWLKRSSRYLPVIEEMLREAELPADLKYVSLAESALRPHVGSPKGAMGFWQFTKETGRKYGLIVDDRIDERRNLFASTRAAIRYFKALFHQFGSWSLATAAFNMGEQGLNAETMVQGTEDYYHLYLPLETQRYLFRVIAVKLILSDPEKYGFRLSEEDLYPPVEAEKIQLVCMQEVPIRIVAQGARTHFKTIKDLNPEIRGHYLAAGSHEIRVPEGSAEDFDSRFTRKLKAYMAEREERVYVVKPGDNLSSIAEKFKVPLQAILIQNKLDPHHPIHPGDRLIVNPGESAP